jgi:hypothetical protein
MREQSPLGGHRAGDGVQRAREGDEEAIALSVNFLAMMGSKGGPQ